MNAASPHVPRPSSLRWRDRPAEDGTRPQASARLGSVTLGRVPAPGGQALQLVDYMPPATGLGVWAANGPPARRVVWLGECGGRCSIDSQVDPPLVQGGDLVGFY